MRLEGWTRVLIVLAVAWLLAIGIGAYMDYPSDSRFGGIPVGPFTFWTVVENPFNQFDAVGSPLGPYEIVPRLKGFFVYGAVPIITLWLSYLAVRWVRHGFRKAVA